MPGTPANTAAAGSHCPEQQQLITGHLARHGLPAEAWKLPGQVTLLCSPVSPPKKFPRTYLEPRHWFTSTQVQRADPCAPCAEEPAAPALPDGNPPSSPPSSAPQQPFGSGLGRSTRGEHNPTPPSSCPLKYLHQCDQDACCTDSSFISIVTCSLANCSSASVEESIWMKAARPLNTLFGNSSVIPLDSDCKAVRKARGA